MAEERRLALAKEAAETEKQKLELKQANHLVLQKEQATLSAVDKQGDYELKLKIMGDAKEQWMKQYELEKLQK